MTEFLPRPMLEAAAPDKVMLDLKYTAFDDVKGDLRVIGTWLFGANGQPCLVIVPSYAPLMERSRNTPCVIPMNEAWRWAEGPGHDDDHGLATLAMWGASGALPIDPMSPRQLRRALGTVRDRLKDLIHMRPAPPRQKRTIGRMNVTYGENGPTDEQEIHDHV